MPARGEYVVEVSTYCGTSRPDLASLPGATRAGGWSVSEKGAACEMVGLRLSVATLRSVFQGLAEILSDWRGVPCVVGGSVGRRRALHTVGSEAGGLKEELT